MADRDAAQSALDATRDALAILIGRTTLGNVLAVTPAGVPNEAVTARLALAADPGVAAAAASLQSAEAITLVAAGQTQPSFSLAGGVGLTRAGTQTSVGPVVSATLSLPLANHLIRAELAGAQATAETAKAALAEAQRDAVQSALRTRAQTDSLAARIPHLQTAYENARRVADATLAGYRLGAVSSADVIAAETQLAVARGALEGARIQDSLAFTTLQLEIGEIAR